MTFETESLEKFRLKLRYKVFYHLGSFCPDVEDVVQETIVRFLKALQEDKIRNPDNLGAFLSGICNNVISEYRRKIWREPPAISDAPFHETPVAPQAELLELQDAIGAALAEMSDRDCEILRGFFLEEKSKEEVCRDTGLTDGQFRVALFRAKERFRRIYRQKLKHEVSGSH